MIAPGCHIAQEHSGFGKGLVFVHPSEVPFLERRQVVSWRIETGRQGQDGDLPKFPRHRKAQAVEVWTRACRRVEGVDKLSHLV
ncbi:MAG: hypothetical protein GWN58_37715 [Anaerolineae bacterium]|nr:hypothetical protein [Anaerolineae bacterium]